jgi:hypothetical protein
VIDILYKVDLILDKYDCILHDGKGCIMIRKGKIEKTHDSEQSCVAFESTLVDDEIYDSVLSASQVKRLARKGARVFLAVIRPVVACHGSVSRCSNLVCQT